jgi:hypothetical protein
MMQARRSGLAVTFSIEAKILAGDQAGLAIFLARGAQ